MSTFREYLTEAKAYTKTGKALTLKSPLDIGSGVSILGMSRDTNGNALLRVEDKTGKKKSLQYKAGGMSTIDIDELVDQSFLKRKEDIKTIVDMV
jgi:CheY-specific phosphatase CheX